MNVCTLHDVGVSHKTEPSLYPTGYFLLSSLQGLIFTETNIKSLQQINCLSLLRRLEHISISIEGNPITSFTLWKPYVLFRLAHFSLRKINDIEVSGFSLILCEPLTPMSDVMSNWCKHKLLEISRLLSHADLHTVELSRTFHQVTHLLCNINKTVFM